VNRHPNATVAGTTGGTAALVVALLHAAGVEVSVDVAVAVVAAVPPVALFIGRNGVRGVIRMLWRGRGSR
jgi:hypothetical protein